MEYKEKTSKYQKAYQKEYRERKKIEKGGKDYIPQAAAFYLSEKMKKMEKEIETLRKTVTRIDSFYRGL